MMEVEYELTPEDVLALQRYIRSHPYTRPQRGAPNPIGRIVWGLILGAVAVLLYQTATDNYPLVQQLSLYLTAFLGGAALALFGGIVYARSATPKLTLKALNQGRNAEKTLGRRRFSIDAEAARNRTDFASVVYYWKGIDKIATTRDHAFVFITTATAFIIPRRVFSNDRAFDDFVEAARRFHGRACDDAVWEMTSKGLWERRGASGIQASDQSGKTGTVEGIVPKEDV